MRYVNKIDYLEFKLEMHHINVYSFIASFGNKTNSFQKIMVVYAYVEHYNKLRNNLNMLLILRCTA